MIYSITDIPAQWRWLMWLNPMGGTIEAYRGAIMGTTIDYTAWAISTGAAVICLVVGLIYFARAERRFADIV